MKASTYNTARSNISLISYVLLALCFIASNLFAQQLDVLVIGSTKSYSDAGPAGLDPGVTQEKAFNPTTIATRLQDILDGDAAITDTVNVVFEDIYKAKSMIVPIGGSGSAWNMQFRCFSLAQHYMWPDGKAARMTNLRGEGTYQWDYIVLVEDPYVMARFPGMYAEGVKLIQSEVANSSNPAQIILLGQWPENSSSFTAAQFNEIVHRVGDSAGIPVAPGAKAWASYTSQDTSSSHPSPKGQYLAACAIYSKMYPRSATSSGYNYTNPAAVGDTLADHVWSEVQSAAATTQYSGKYTTENAFQMSYVQERACEWNKYGSSTESGFANGVNAALSSAKVTSTVRSGSAANPLDMAYSRGTDAFEPDKQYNYLTRLDNADRNHGFPMGDHIGTASTEAGALTMRYGIDKRYYAASSFYNGTDLGVAHSMVCENEISQNVRGIPVRLLWSKMEHANLGLSSHRDSWHLSNELDRAVGAYLYTLLSGRCPVEVEPADNTSTAWKQWWCRKMGYETAWQMAHLTTRAPGFRVCPSSATALTIAPGATETMTVEFINPPQSDVTVTVSLSNTTAAIVGSKTLIFTPSNYNTPQQVIVAAIPGASASESFNVNFATSSTDLIYNGLSDSWDYTTSRSSTVSVSQTDNGTTNIIALQNTPLAINLNAASSNAGNTILVGPFHGSVTWSSDSVIEYTPDNGYLGKDFIVYAATVGSTQTIGCLDITVEVPNGQVNSTVGDGSASEEGPDTGTFVINRLGGDTSSSLDVLFSMSGTATLGSDYTLSHSSPVTIPVGQDSVTVTVTPIDDSVFGELYESVILTITPDAAYPIGAASAIVTIADNDNTLPIVDAGVDQAVYLVEGPATPGWSYQAWTGDADSDISSTYNYTALHCFGGNNAGTVTVNGVAFPESFGSSGTGWSVAGSQANWQGNDDANVTGDSEKLAQEFIHNGNPRTITLTGLTPGQGYQLDLFSVAFETGDRSQTFSATGGSSAVINQDAYGNNKGIRISCFYTASSTSQEITITPTVGNSFHFYAMTNRSVTVIRATATLNGSVTDSEQTPTGTWSKVSGPGTVTFSDANVLNATATFIEAGTYVLRLTADDGYGPVFDEVTITVSIAINTPPLTDAGVNQTVYLTAGSSFTPGITYHPITSDEDSGISSGKTYTHAVDFGSDATRALINGVQFQASDTTTFGGKAGTSATVGTGTTTISGLHAGSTTAAPYLNGASPCGMEDLVKDMNYNTSAGVITLTGLTPGLHYQFRLYNRAWGTGTRSQNIGFNVDGVGSDITGAEYTGTFYEDDASQPDPSFATATQVYALTFDYSLPAGVTSLNVYINQISGGTYHLYGLTNEEVSAAGATATLDGTVIDDEQTPSGSWTVVGGNASAVSFTDVNAIDTTAIFTEAGTYVLRLTGADGYTQSTDDVTITVNPPLPSKYAAWSSGGGFSNPFTDTSPNSNPDGDQMNNTMEFAFGTDPTVSNGGTVAVNGSANGLPTPIKGVGGVMELYFVRRKDYGTSGSVSYTVQFSSDLGNFYNNTEPLTVVANSSVNSNYEVVKVAYPASLPNGQAGRFGRIKIEFVP